MNHRKKEKRTIEIERLKNQCLNSVNFASSVVKIDF